MSHISALAPDDKSQCHKASSTADRSQPYVMLNQPYVGYVEENTMLTRLMSIPLHAGCYCGRVGCSPVSYNISSGQETPHHLKKPRSWSKCGLGS